MMIRDLPNLGPRSQEMLAKAGVTTFEQIAELGSVRTFVAVKKIDNKASLNLLYALEGLLTNQSWRDVAKNDRLSLLMQIEYLESTQDE